MDTAPSSGVELYTPSEIQYGATSALVPPSESTGTGFINFRDYIIRKANDLVTEEDVYSRELNSIPLSSIDRLSVKTRAMMLLDHPNAPLYPVRGSPAFVRNYNKALDLYKKLFSVEDKLNRLESTFDRLDELPSQEIYAELGIDDPEQTAQAGEVFSDGGPRVSSTRGAFMGSSTRDAPVPERSYDTGATG